MITFYLIEYTGKKYLRDIDVKTNFFLYFILAVLSTLVCSVSFAGGYKIPETSLNSTALSSAYVASANGADSSYYNPANMVFNENNNYVEVSLSYIHIAETNYQSAITPLLDARSKSENFLIPNLHYSSKANGNLRFGLSIVSPGGLAKRWDDILPKASSEEFTLKTIELNPTMAYKVNSVFALGGGVRFVHANGTIKSDSSDLNTINPTIPSVARNMSGDNASLSHFGYGYNLALGYKPSSALSFGLTYRSKIDLELEGNAKLLANGIPVYDGPASVSIPLPATLDIAMAYTFLHSPSQATTIEFVYERSYWSSFKELDFNYSTNLPLFDAPIAKNWTNSNTLRLGLTHHYNPHLTLLFGYARDESPIPTETLGFEFPSTNGDIFSTGFEYQLNKQQSIGFAYLYNQRKETMVNNDYVNGTFKNINAYLLTLAYKQSF